MNNRNLAVEGIRRDIPLALYYQLKVLIKSKIESGEWEPGTKIPSEEDLARMCSVSRMTARQAVKELVQEGWLYRETGKGSFVADHRFQQRLSRLTSFTEDMKERGVRPGARLLSARVLASMTQICNILQLPPDTQIIELARVRLAEGKPIALETMYIPQALCPDILSQDLTGSITELMENRYGLKFAYAEQRVSGSLCTTSEARLLEVRPRSVVLRMQRLYFSELGKPTHYVESAYRADRYELLLRLQR